MVLGKVFVNDFSIVQYVWYTMLKMHLGCKTKHCDQKGQSKALISAKKTNQHKVALV